MLVSSIVNDVKATEEQIADITSTLKKLGHDNISDARRDSRPSVKLLVDILDKSQLDLKRKISREVVFCDGDKEETDNR